MNAMSRKHLGYCTPEELFEEFLDKVYSVLKVRASQLYLTVQVELEICEYN